jgi:AraC-like DNA-binding protein
MDPRSIPTYREGGRVYHADSCVPLVEAVKRGDVFIASAARGTYPGRPLPRGVLPGLRTTGYWDASREQTWGLARHRNEGIELTFLETGRMPFALDRGRFNLEPGDLTITRPWQPHRVGNPHIGIGRLYWLILDVGVRQPHQAWRWPSWIVLAPEDLGELTRILRESERPVWKASAAIQDGWRQIGQVVSADRAAGWSSRLAVHVNALFLHLLEMFRARRVTLTKSLTSARRSTSLFLDALRGTLAEKWTLESMARASGLGITRFVHYCRQVTNRTPIQYLNQLRVDRACALLRNEPRRSITDIALDCGFSSSQYFATVFRRIARFTPRDYRRRARTR